MKEFFGVRAWRQKPLAERLMPWPVYALLTVMCLGLGLWMLTGPDGLHNTRPFAILFLVFTAFSVYLTVLSRRVRG